MNDNIPPKQTLGEMPVTPTGHPGYDHLPPADPSSGGGQHGLVLHDSSLHGDANSFPVLKAFQDYLETERQQARKRLVTLTVFFVSLMTLVVAGFIIAFVFLFSSMSKREERLLDAALQPRKEVAPPAPALTAQQVAKEFQAVAMNLQTNLSSQLAIVGGVANNMGGKVEAQNAELAKLRDAMAVLQKENASLRADLPKLAIEAVRKVSPPAVSPALRPPAATPPAATPAPPSPAAATAGLPAAAAGKPLKGYEETMLIIRSRDSENNIPWRAFVPR